MAVGCRGNIVEIVRCHVNVNKSRAPRKHQAIFRAGQLNAHDQRRAHAKLEKS